MSDRELKVTRRSFMKYSAAATAASAATYTIALKTDAVAQAQQEDPLAEGDETVLQYQYNID